MDTNVRKSWIHRYNAVIYHLTILSTNYRKKCVAHAMKLSERTEITLKTKIERTSQNYRS